MCTALRTNIEDPHFPTIGICDRRSLTTSHMKDKAATGDTIIHLIRLPQNSQSKLLEAPRYELLSPLLISAKLLFLLRNSSRLRFQKASGNRWKVKLIYEKLTKRYSTQMILRKTDQRMLATSNGQRTSCLGINTK